MARKKSTTPSPISEKVPASSTSQVQAADPLAAVLAQVQRLLDEGKPKEASELISRHSAAQSPRLRNAYGVCLLRLGQAEAAVKLFRPLVLASGGLLLREDVPLAFKINFATALLLQGNIAGGLSIVRELRGAQEPSVQRLQQAIGKWRSQLSILQKIRWFLGTEPKVPLQLSFPPGELC